MDEKSGLSNITVEAVHFTIDDLADGEEKEKTVLDQVISNPDKRDKVPKVRERQMVNSELADY